MKQLPFFILVIITLSALLFGADSNITRKGGWGTGIYNDIFTKDHYAYIAADWNGLDIIDISDPSKPLAVGNLNLNSQANSVHVNGNYAYVACLGGLHIVDVSIPASPKATGFYSLEDYYDKNLGIRGRAAYVVADGQYAYLAITFAALTNCSIEILDVSNPTQPQSTGSSIPIDDWILTDKGFPLQKKGHYLFYCMPEPDYTLEIYDVSAPLSPQHINTINLVEKFFVNTDYVYIIFSNELRILNITDPKNPQQVGTYDINIEVNEIFAAGNYFYAAEKTAEKQWLIQIFDVSNPAAPSVLGNCSLSTAPSELIVTGETALVTAKEHGLYTFNVSNPAAPRFLKNYDVSWSPVDIFVTGNRAYVADSYGELKIFDIAVPTSPVLLGTYISSSPISALFVYGNYTYLATLENGLEIINITDPTKPVKSGSSCTNCCIRDITIRGNFAYIIKYNGSAFYILDLADPAAPQEVSHISINSAAKINIEENYAILSGEYGVDAVDITNPASPLVIEDFYGGLYTRVGGVCNQAPYTYVANNNNKLCSLDIFDFRPPSRPLRIGQYYMKDNIYDLFVNGNYVYVAASSGLYVMDVSHPTSPIAAGYLTANVLQGAVTIKGKYIYLITGNSGRLEVLEFKTGNKPPQLRVSHNILRFHADHAKNLTVPQSIFIDTCGDNKLAWTLETFEWTSPSKIDWIECSQTSGAGSAEIWVSIDPDKVEQMLKFEYDKVETGYIAISAPNALNSELNILVSIAIDKNTDPRKPFGEFSAPPGNTVVSGSVPVTGWALDNIGVSGVQIYREVGDQLAFIGDTVFVEGARPDVEMRFQGYPRCFKAGWGYMLLTQSLPGGDGQLTLHAVATDMEGNRVTLGTTTVIVANANSAKPFGALDTPGQGDTISGKGVVNFGWALTPLPNTIPTDGSTIRVWIDGIAAGQPVYNQYRKDLEEQFPGLNNSGGAAGYFILDTTRYGNGVHTIAWTVEDDAGNADGIGSRYFQVRNKTAVSDSETVDHPLITHLNLENAEIDSQPVHFKTGFKLVHEPETAFVSQDGVSTISIHQLERIEVDLDAAPGAPGGNMSGYLQVGHIYRPLPIGSTLDAQNGIFYWQPGPGFVGTYDFIFVKKYKNNAVIIKKLEVNIAIN